MAREETAKSIQKKNQSLYQKDKKDEERERQNKQQMADMPGRDETHIRSQNDVYLISDELGKGSFGAVYKVTRQTDGKQMAIKCESVHVKKQILAHEARVLQALNLLKSVHFVELLDRGRIPDRFLFVVIRLVGRNLWDIRTELPDRRYSLNTAMKLAEQTLAGIRDLHRVGFLHRDIKPPNFAVGREVDGTLQTVYVLDFGLCRQICPKGSDLRTPRSHCAFRGTTRYASLAAHCNKEQSRKDDIEAWWYMATEMIIYELPWRSAKSSEREKVKIAKKKLREEEGAAKALFVKWGAGDQMVTILNYLDNLAYNSIPDYDYVYSNLNMANFNLGLKENQSVDWDPNHDYSGPKYKKGEAYIVKELLSI